MDAILNALSATFFLELVLFFVAALVISYILVKGWNASEKVGHSEQVPEDYYDWRNGELGEEPEEGPRGLMGSGSDERTAGLYA